MPLTRAAAQKAQVINQIARLIGAKDAGGIRIGRCRWSNKGVIMISVIINSEVGVMFAPSLTNSSDNIASELMGTLRAPDISHRYSDEYLSDANWRRI